MRFRFLTAAAAIALSAYAATPSVAVGPQYDSTHAYVAPRGFRPFRRESSSHVWRNRLQARRFHGHANPQQHDVANRIDSGGHRLRIRLQDADSLSVRRRTHRLSRHESGRRESTPLRAAGADVLVSPFNDPIGRDAIIQWPGGVNMQLYWHTTAPSYAPLQTIPENRVYVSADKANAFTRGFLAFSHGKTVSDDARAPGIEIGRPDDTYRRIRIESAFGKITVLVTDGHLPYPYGRETTGYEVTNLGETLAKAKAAGVQILVGPYAADRRDAAVVQFPGGYIAEIHAVASGK